MSTYRYRTHLGEWMTVEALRVEFTPSHVIFRAGTIFEPVIVCAVSIRLAEVVEQVTR